MTDTQIRLVAIDLDDTLVRDDNTVSAYTCDVMQRVQAQGVHIVIATGRMYQTAKPIGMALGLGDVPMILYSGGVVQHVASGNMVVNHCVPIPTAVKVIETAKAHGWYIQYAAADKLVIEEETEQNRMYRKATGATATIAGEAFTVPTVAPNKLLIIEDPSKMPDIRKVMSEAVGEEVTLVNSKPHFLEVIPKGISKGVALEELANTLGIPPEHIVAFGNAPNDIPMLSYAGTSVAVANADDVVLEMAQEQCGSNNEDGVARWLEQNLL